MIEEINFETNNVFALRIKGKNKEKYFWKKISELNNKSEQMEKSAIYAEIENFTSLSLETLAEAFKQGFGQFKNFGKKAIVADKSRLHKVIAVFEQYFPNTEIRYFSFESKDEARSWVAN